MPRKQFLEHLSEASNSPAHPKNRIVGLRRGEDDGSFVFTYLPIPVGEATKEDPVELEALIPDLSQYPTKHQTFIYATSANPPEYVTSTLESIKKDGVALPQLVLSLAAALDKAALQKLGSCTEASEDEDDEIDQIDDGVFGGWSSDGGSSLDDHGDASDTLKGPSSSSASSSRKNSAKTAAISSLKDDLRAARAAGYRVAVLTGADGTASPLISLSVRISKLGISDEAMGAWKLDKNEYLVLLLHYNRFYRNLDELVNGTFQGRQAVRFRIGACGYYKPTVKDARNAFKGVGREGREAKEDVDMDVDGDVDGHRMLSKNGYKFNRIFISAPLEELLSSRLIELVKHRINYRFLWDGAERFLADYYGKKAPSHASQEYMTPTEEAKSYAPIVSADALDIPEWSPKQISFPLVAMQYSLRHLVRCTDFCLVCHQRIHSDFTALKPYVCSNPLCLYQYMKLGFGPSIEYEIISQPAVVDLLITFCYVAAKHNTLTEFPTGMDLCVPPTMMQNWSHFKPAPDPHLANIKMIHPPLKVGDWVQLCPTGNAVSQHYRVDDIIGSKANLSRSEISTPIIRRVPDSNSFPKQETEDESTARTMQAVSFGAYNVKFDTLSSTDKSKAIVTLLETLPKVMDMKRWLEANSRVGEEASLKNWKDRISPAACGLLRWIVASNRSCIVATQVPGSSPGGLPHSVANDHVWGMSGWTQFRFATGSPDKEQIFVGHVKSLLSKGFVGHPTMYAFHGSALENWHSIIREGLNFNKVINGRAYGNGCYHSLNLATSVHYCKPALDGSTTWPQSDLGVTHAVSLNEIIFAPHQFVATTPHLVIAQLSWIQTRYLFVCSEKSKVVAPPDGEPPTDIVKLSDTWTPVNANGTKLKIPAGAGFRITSQTEQAPPPQSLVQQAASLTKPSKLVKRQIQKKEQKEDEYASDSSVATEPEDASFLDESDVEEDMDNGTDDQGNVEKRNVLLKKGQRLISKASMIFSKKDKGKDKEKTQQASNKSKDFELAAIDMRGIELLPPPTYASSAATRRLQAELKAMFKLQEKTPLQELGWYINPNMVTNVYQWLFEFHSFDEGLPLAMDMKAKGVKSIVLEARFGSGFPMSPPFVRVIKPRFLGFAHGGGGHVTMGGALCMELLTNNGWSAVATMESVFLQVRMAMTSLEPNPARLLAGNPVPYTPGEAKAAFERACRLHGWEVPADFKDYI